MTIWTFGYTMLFVRKLLLVRYHKINMNINDIFNLIILFQLFAGIVLLPNNITLPVDIEDGSNSAIDVAQRHSDAFYIVMNTVKVMSIECTRGGTLNAIYSLANHRHMLHAMLVIFAWNSLIYIYLIHIKSLPFLKLVNKL